MLAAVEQAAAGASNTVLLTRLGGGVFGNAENWIDDAIVRALRIVEHAGLDVRLVSFGRVHPSMQAIADRWEITPWPHDNLLHAWWVEPNRLLAGEYPGARTPEKAAADRILARIRDEMEAGRLVYVHCWGGKGRTSTVIGCLLADTGLDYTSTVARIAVLRAGTRKAHERCPESGPQRDVLRARCAR